MQTRADSNYFLQGGGEMGELTRNYDWSSTPVGPVSQWPVHLRTTVSLLLSSKFPMFLWWGEDMIQFYNDAYRPSLGVTGKHPGALGQKAKDCWPEIWDIIYPQIQQVQTTGEATWHEDMLVPIFRNGKIEDVYWTYGYSPVKGEDTIDGVLVVCTETTQKVSYVKELDKSKQELEFAIEASGLGTWDLNPVEMRFSANQRLKDWFGVSEDGDVQLSQVLEYIVESDRARVVAAINKALDPDSKGLYDIEYTIQNPQTMEKRVVRAVGKAVFNDKNVCIRFNGTLQDITGQRAAMDKVEQLVNVRTEELQKSNTELEKSNAALSQFAYIASHDLQEPLRKVNIFSQLLSSHLGVPQDEKTLRYISKISEGATRSIALVRDILAYSTVPNGQEMSKEEVDLDKTIKALLVDFDVQIEQRNALITMHDLPVIKGNRVQLSQLFSNLLSNALKFCDANRRPVINISAKRNTGECNENSEIVKPAYWDIVFEDNGIGFEQEYAEKIFNIFHRLYRHADYEGTGIGLSLCRKIAENHGGYIYAKSTPGSGSSFHIMLPATASETV
jgi:signal transduction histidine kinase